jgi:hypothetical protein
MKCYKVRKKPAFMKDHEKTHNWWCSGKGRDIWHNLSAVRGAIKTSYIPHNETIDMYEIVEFDMVMTTTIEFQK